MQVKGRTAVQYRLIPSSGLAPITLLRIDQKLLHLHLHAGSVEPAPGQWHYGPAVTGAERSHLVAAFNGGFKLRDSRGGWLSEGRLVAPLRPGAPSVVIYSDGSADIVTGDGKTVAPPPPTVLLAGASGLVHGTARTPISVLQNVGVLVANGVPVSTFGLSPREITARWGTTYAGATFVARSGIGITADGHLVWGASDRTSVDALAAALRAAGAVRAIQLDINAPLVRGFLFPHAQGATDPSPTFASGIVPLVVGQTKTPRVGGNNLLRVGAAPHCDYLTPCTRDFFTLTTL